MAELVEYVLRVRAGSNFADFGANDASRQQWREAGADIVKDMLNGEGGDVMRLGGIGVFEVLDAKLAEPTEAAA